ncbi:MAG: biotin synthase BioB [Thermodesulfobacteriota bacterium]
MTAIPAPLTDLDLAARLLQPADLAELGELMAQANRARQAAHGGAVEFCAIVNARSGRCSEDCAFCAQSARHHTTAEVYPLMTADEIVARARMAATAGAVRFGIVTSGKGCPAGRSLDEICRAIERIRGEGLISPCASLGLLAPDQARRLAAAGLARYHHNLEAGPSHFPRICTSHAFADRAATVRAAQAAGLEVCVGGIVGLGESPRERAELALAAAELNPQSVPINFLNPIPGTPLGHLQPLTPLEALAAVAVFRLMLPKARIRTCGGRQQVLGNLAPLMYLAGADATMIGNYLTTEGRQPADDFSDLAALGLRAVAREG